MQALGSPQAAVEDDNKWRLATVERNSVTSAAGRKRRQVKSSVDGIARAQILPCKHLRLPRPLVSKVRVGCTQ